MSSLLEKSFADRFKFLNKDGVLDTLNYDTSKGFVEHEVWGQSWHIRGSIAYAELTGDTSAMKVADAIADHVFLRSLPIVFQDGKPGGDLLHSSDQGCGFAAFLGLMDLYERIGREPYLKFARAAADTMLPIKPASFQTHSALSGWRSVLKVYEYTGDRKYLDAIVKIANEVVAKNQIATCAVWGGINRPCVCEGCGAADWFLLNYELWQLTGDAMYLDRAETILYSAVYYMQSTRGGFTCTEHSDAGCFWSWTPGTDITCCCTQKGAMALCRALQSCLAADDAGVYVNFFMPIRALLSVKGNPVEIRMDTDYPNTGKVSLQVINAPDNALSMRVRIPAWSKLQSASLNGRDVKLEPTHGFVVVNRRWRKGDTLDVALSIKLRIQSGASGHVGEPLQVAEADGEKQVKAASLYWGPVLLGLNSSEKPKKRYTLVVPLIPNAEEIGTLPAADMAAPERTSFSIPNAHFKVLVSKEGFAPPSKKKLALADVKELSQGTLVPLSEMFAGQALGVFDLRSPADKSITKTRATAAEKPNWLPQFKPPAGVRVLRDLQYIEGGHQRNRLDLYLPEKADQCSVGARLPLVVWVHGGGWVGGNKDNCPALPLATKGYAVASINYRLAQHAVFPAQIQDCKAAIRWLRAHAAQYQLDPEHVGVWVHRRAVTWSPCWA